MVVNNFPKMAFGGIIFSLQLYFNLLMYDTPLYEIVDPFNVFCHSKTNNSLFFQLKVMNKKIPHSTKKQEILFFDVSKRSIV